MIEDRVPYFCTCKKCGGEHMYWGTPEVAKKWNNKTTNSCLECEKKEGWRKQREEWSNANTREEEERKAELRKRGYW